MRGPSRVSRAVRQRVETLDRGLEVSLESDAEGLHKARVATRRLREALPLLVPPDSAAPIADLRHVVRDATRALGGVREMDVALSLVNTLATERPDLAPSLDAIRTAMSGERSARVERMRQRLDVGALQQASRSLADHVDQFADDRRSTALLAERLLDRIEGLRRAVADAGNLYAPERLHRIRLAAKKLRYVLELVGEVRAAATGRVLPELRRMQELLGLLHDLETVAHHARRALAQSPAAGGSTPTLLLLDAKIRDQHAEYLARRHRLMALLDRAMAVYERMQGREQPPAATPRAARRKKPPRPSSVRVRS